MRLVSVYFEDYYPFNNMGVFDEFVCLVYPEDLKQGDVLVVWGGGDISPSLYNKKTGYKTGANDTPSKRDFVEWAMMQRAKELGCIIIGVCRGGQMLTALAGGYLIQHVDNHAGPNHPVITLSEEMFTVNSIHHQMMMPFTADGEPVDHTTLAWCPAARSKAYYDVDTLVDVDIEREYIYYPEVKGHAIQWHPEGMPHTSAATQYIFKTIKELM